ncbi:MAG: glycosyltransferase 87 family protein, partial [Solirubrobacteraceae bacterium]
MTPAAAPLSFDRRILALSVVLQLALATLFGHAYDARVFMATGYLVGTGRGPYSPLDLSTVFQHVGFDQLTTIGYPPPWALVTGALYRATYALVPNLLVYDLALKIPVILATVGLAYLVAALLWRAGAQARTCHRAWAFLLLNPLILFTGAAWGQIDVIVTLLAVAALLLIWQGRWASSAALLALAGCTKPTPLPIVLVVLVWLAGKAPWQALRYAAVLAAWAAVFLVVPVFALGWRTTQIRLRPNAPFLMTGGLSPTTVARLFRDPLQLPGHWWL